MKKYLCLLLCCLVMSGCEASRRFTSGPLISDEEGKAVESLPEGAIEVSRGVTRVNVAMKEHGEDFVTYEYRDVRVDQLLPLARQFCAEKGLGEEPVLRQILLYRNNMRRASFVCR